MSGIIEGFNYDIFISYRQKDNKYDGWVTEFVENLKKELEATFKEDISVYFDINPHDGLLETHDVDESLKDKLKCLILLKNGRAIMFPVYKGTFERKDEEELPVSSGHQYVDWVIKMVKDFRRSVDYLETRPDIDTSKLGFYGASWGGMMGAIVPAVEDRLKINILVIPGLWGVSLPETDELNYLPRVKIPTLMLNGIYDYRFPLENNIKSFYKLLGTSENDKKLILYPTDHYVPMNEMIKEILSWCDKYLGPVSQ